MMYILQNHSRIKARCCLPRSIHLEICCPCLLYAHTHQIAVDQAGALVAYLWRNRSLSKTSEQLNSIVGILIFNLILGGIQDTSIDNVGERSLLQGCHPTCLAAMQGGLSGDS